MPTSDTPIIEIDAAIVGGGIAGTWLLNLLSAKGYQVVLLERDAIGADQTLASQGMIHGGLKYALAGALTGASEAIADMPARWRSCLAGNDDVDLREVTLLSDTYYMFADNAIGSRWVVSPGFGAKPVLVPLYNAFRFANWVHNGRLLGGDTENGAYTLVGGTPIPQDFGSGAGVVLRESGAVFAIPTT